MIMEPKDKTDNWIDANLKKHSKEKKKLKLKTLHEMDKLILCYMNSILRSQLLSYDIIRLILLFYMYDLSKYEYISVFTETNKALIKKGHLSAFNLTDNLYSMDIQRKDINSSLSQLFTEIYGTTFRLFSLNKFPPFIRNNLFPKYGKMISDNLNLHVLFRMEANKKVNYDMSASLIELDEHKLLSTNNKKKKKKSEFDRCELLQSSIHGLIALGGDTKKVQFLNWNKLNNKFEWNDNGIKSMNEKRINHKAVFLENHSKIFTCGGNTATYTGEIYDFKKNKWKKIKNMNMHHSCFGIYYDKNRNYVYSLASYSGHKKCEKYDFHKNEWYYLPNVNYKHRWHPVVKMMDNNNVLMITGDFYKYNKDQKDWGHSEYLDLRDNTFKKWKIINKDISKALQFKDNDYYHQKYMRGIWLL
eukprot:143231_1